MDQRTQASCASGPVTSAGCYHCGEPLPADPPQVAVGGELRPVCCHGCQAAVELLCSLGLERYYRARQGRPPRVREGASAAAFAAWDAAELQPRWVRALACGDAETTLVVDGLACPSCAWVVEQRLARVPGVRQAAVSYAGRQAQVRFDPARVRLSRLLHAVAELGYGAQPREPGAAEALAERAQRTLLRRFVVGGVLAVQVMMLAIAWYGGEHYGIDPAYRSLIAWAMLALAVPAVLYAGQGFWRSGLLALARGRVNMDVPVALGLAIGVGASAVAVVRGSGALYLDSVTMLVAVLAAGRYLELAARRRAGAVAEALGRAQPVQALRMIDGGRSERVAAVALRPGDRVLVRPGEHVPADGVVEGGTSGVDQAVLTGESRPRPVAPGARVLAGSVNGDGPLTVRVERAAAESFRAQIERQLERVQAARGALTRLADQVAPWFVTAVLVAAAVAGWLAWGTGDVVGRMVAVLVVGCPCALSLAAPAAVTVATGALLERGVLALSPDALDRLARIDTVALDKTGTLTGGHPSVEATQVLREGLDSRRAIRLAAALERYSSHPLARAIVDAADGEVPEASAVEVVTGEGVRGVVEGRRLAVGRVRFAAPGTRLPASAGSEVVLADARGPMAVFVLTDRVRDDAREALAALAAGGHRVVILSGDSEAAVRGVAGELGIAEASAALSPAGKLARLEALRRSGRRVAMVGDGVNDAPTLAAADAGIAIGSGSDLARLGADLVLLGPRLAPLDDAFRIARRCRAVVRQNFAWALAYNLIAIPAAVAGLVGPLAAGIGMSLSSLLVVANALRLR